MIPRFRPPHSLSDIGAVFSLKSHGESLSGFEEKFAALAEQRYARVFPYGRTALVAILEHLRGKSEGHEVEVICPSYTCVVVAHAIVEAGCTPVFVDSDSNDLSMNWTDVLKATSARTLAVISTSLYGNPVERTGLTQFRTTHPGIPVVQDCAHSFFADGIHKEGLVAIYGLNISKIMTTIFGGVATTDSQELAAALRDYQRARLHHPRAWDRVRRALYFFGSLMAFSRPVYWLTYRLIRLGALGKFVDYYRPNLISLPKDAYRQMGVLEAQLGIRQVRRYHSEIKRRRNIAQIYSEALADVAGLRVIDYSANSTYSHFVVVSNMADYLEKKMARVGVELGRVIEYDVASMQSYAGSNYFGAGSSRDFSRLVLNLPVHRGIGPREAAKIANHMRRLDIPKG